MISLLRAFFQSWQNLARQAWLWLATIAVFFLAFTSVNALVGAHALAQQVLGEARSRVDVAISFKSSTPPSVVEQARTYLVALPNVAEVSVVTADQALEAFRARFRQDESVMKALTEVGRNPLGATVIVRATSLDEYEKITAALDVPAYKEWIQENSVAEHAGAIHELERLQGAVQLVGSLLLVLFACIALLLVFNAVRLAIFAQRDEILIMRLVGAPKWRIRLPYVLTVFWVTLFAWIAVIGIGSGIYAWLLPQTMGWMRSGLLTMATMFQQSWVVLLGAELGVAGLLAMLIAWIAAGKYVKR